SQVSILLYISYTVINIFLILFKIKSLAGAGCRAGKLVLVNLIFLLSVIYLSNLTNLLNITWHTCHKIYCIISWIAIILLLFHIIIII
ncbi:hypothetical protein BO85DRAFT_381629, partial [Aspergillus piperis CBS 112811]